MKRGLLVGRDWLELMLGCADNINPHDSTTAKLELILRRSSFAKENLGIVSSSSTGYVKLEMVTQETLLKIANVTNRDPVILIKGTHEIYGL